MSNIPTGSISNVSKHNGYTDKVDDKKDLKTTKAEAKTQQNVAILEAHEKVSLNSDNEPLKLLYKAALEGINEALQPTMGENAAQKIYDSGVDTGPEATADRIVSFATNFYELYKEANPGEDEEETLNNFLNIIMKGVDTGFDEAKDLLTGLKVFDGKIESDANETYDLIKQGFAAFREQTLESLAAANEEAKEEDSEKTNENESD